MRGKRLTDQKVLSVEENKNRGFAAQKAEAQLAQARAQLKPIETDLERLTVRAPVDGQVLQVKVHLGEFAPTGSLPIPLILLGNVEKLHVRVDVEEHEAWRSTRSESRRCCARQRQLTYSSYIR
jgi:multidrug resistance efflux pump